MNPGRQHYQNTIGQFDPLSREEVKTLYELIDYGTEFEQDWARNKMIQHNLRLVVKIASRYRLDESMMEDAIQEGNQGLIRAVEKFNPEMGYAFSTYADNWIRYRIEQYVREHFHVVSIPIETQKANSKVVKAQREMSKSMHESDITAEHLAEKLGMSVKEVETSLSLIQSKVYLDADISKDESSANHYTYYGDPVDHEATLENSITMAQIAARIDELPAQQRDMVRRHYGIDCPEESLQDIGDAYKLSRERVRQIIKAGVERIRDVFSQDQMQFAV